MVVCVQGVRERCELTVVCVQGVREKCDGGMVQGVRERCESGMCAGSLEPRCGWWYVCRV